MLKPETIGLNTLLCSFDKVGKYAVEAILCDVVDFSSDVSPEMIQSLWVVCINLFFQLIPQPEIKRGQIR